MLFLHGLESPERLHWNLVCSAQRVSIIGLFNGIGQFIRIQEATMERDIVKTGLILALVCAIAAGSLALTQNVTSGIIAERQERELQAMLIELLPTADSFELVTEENAQYYLGKSSGQLVGAVVVGEASGYGGLLQLLVAVNPQGVIQSVNVRSQSETIGIGSRAMQPEFLDQFRNLTPEKKPVPGTNVDMLQGATISSRAVTSAVGKALDIFGQYVLGMSESDEKIDFTKVPDGVYEGSAEGFEGSIKVKVTVAQGKITKVEVTEQHDTPEVAGAAIQGIPGRIVEQQDWRVDVVSGATYTSQGIMNAVKNAMPDTSLNVSRLADGEYEGQAEGFSGMTKVKVKVAGGKITTLEVTAHADTKDVAEPAFRSLIDAIKTQQSLKVDTVTGATYSSEGFLAAVLNALEKAPLK